MKSRGPGILMMLLIAVLVGTVMVGQAYAQPAVSVSGYEIDIKGSEPPIPVDLEPQGDGKYKKWIVQFTGPVHEKDKKQLVALGARVGDYLPDFAFLVTMDNTTKKKVEELPFINGVVRYKPAYKISRKLKDDTGAVRAEKGNTMKLTVRFDGADKLPLVLSQVHRKKGKVLDVSGAVVRVEADQTHIGSFAQIEEVLWIEETPDLKVLNDTSRWVIQTYSMNNTKIWDNGLHGEGQIVGVGDTGLDYDMPWFRDSLGTSIGPGHRKVIGYDTTYGDDYDADDSGHGTHVSGTVAGDRTPVDGLSNANGMAPKAKLYMQDLTPGSSGYVYPPSDLGLMFITTYDVGARLHTNSWGGYDNSYGTMAMTVDRFMWEHKDFLALFANGNSGPGADTVHNPATAKNVISVGATNNGSSAESMASFSSRGNTTDGRLKPTITAPGVSIISADSDGIKNSNNSGTLSMSGTSMATPTVAGAAALVRQYFAYGYYPSGSASHADAFSPSAALTKATIINSAQNMTGSYTDGSIPSKGQGWGRINLSNTLVFTGDTRTLEVLDEASGLATGQGWSAPFYTAGGQLLKVTLVWTDYPGAEYAAKALVNDLDLTVTGPDGTVYLGNVFSNGSSVSGGSADRLNVEEQILIPAAASGAYTVTVSGYNIPNGPQPFAVVLTGASAVTSKGFITLNRTKYNGSGTVVIKVADRDLNANIAVAEQVSVNIKSTAEPAGETVVLNETGIDTGVFIGSISLSTTAPVGGNGSLEVVDADTVTATYEDANDGSGAPATMTATAVVDATPPVISAVAAGPVSETKATVTWITNEPAGSLVSYGTGTDARASVSDGRLVLQHSLNLTGLLEGRTYSYDVASTDEAGNTAVDNNGGSFYTFTMPLQPPSIQAYSSHGSETYYDYTIIYGIASDPSGIASIAVNGAAAAYRSSDGYYEASATLAMGTNVITITAKDTSGNEQSVTMTVVRKDPPDLIVNSVSGPAIAATGGSATILDAIGNIGVGDAAAFAVRYYLSTDSMITTADTYVGQRTIVSLAAGAASSGETVVTIPLTLKPGIYHIGAIADYNDILFEADELNNSLAGGQVTVEGPDLAVVSVNGPAEGLTGGQILVTNTVANNGVATSSGFTVGFYISTDAVITTSDIYLGSRTVIGLSPGQASTADTSLKIPTALANRSYFIGAIADHENKLGEPDESNNALAGNQINVIGPDLAVTEVSGPATGLTEGAITVRNTVTASAAGGSSSGFYVSLYLSWDNVITTSDKFLGSRYVSGLAPGQASTADTVVTIPNLTGGTYYVGAIADSGGSIAESDESNNSLAGNQITIAGPDLGMTTVSGPASAGNGSAITVESTVAADASGGGVSGFYVGIYLSTDAAITTSDTLVGSRYVSGLAPDQSSASGTTVRIPGSLASGAYYIGAIADYMGYFTEANRSNNSMAGNQITITKPDIIMSAVSGPAAGVTRGEIAVSTTVSASPAGGDTGNFSIGIYLSTDSVITASDTFLGTRSIGSLAAGASSTGNTIVDLPSTLTSGAYYIGAIADSGASIAESDEGNNSRAGNQLTVTGPDLVMTAVSGPETASSGQTITISDTVLSSGGGASDLLISFYLSADPVITTSDISIGSRYLYGGLAPGGSNSGSTSITLRDNLASGMYYLGAVADPYNYVKETNEANNGLAGNKIIVINPDLNAVSVAGPSDAKTQESFTVSSSLMNRGPGAASDFYVGIYISTDKAITTADKQIGYYYVSSLAPGATYRADTVVAIPSTVAGGAYYIGVIADMYNYLKEPDEANNALAGNQIAVTAPDLTMNAVSGPSTGVTGGNIAVSTTVTASASGGGAGYFYVGIYLSSDSSITTSDTRIGTRYVSGLAAGASSTGEALATIPVTLDAGTYYIGAIADYSAYVTESNETNNVFTGNQIIVAGPDLTMTAVSGPANSYNGATITVRNTATASAAGGTAPTFYVYLYVSADSTITTGDTYLGYRSVSGLAPGQSSTADTVVTIQSSMAGGTYYLGAIVDPYNYVKEGDETNNSLSGNQLAVANPDLTISTVSGPATGLTAGSITVANTVTATADGGTASGFYVGIYLSTDNNITTSDTRIAYRSVSGLAPGASSTEDTVITLPGSFMGGTYYIGAIADFWSSVTESNESNNALAGNQITVLNADLTTTALSGPSSGGTAGQIIVNTTVAASANGGGASGFSVGIYLSTDSTITTYDTFLGYRYVSGLAPGQTSTADTVVTIPSTLSNGTYYIGAISDYQNYVIESSETNNALAGNQISLVGPDLTMTAASGPSIGLTAGSITIRNTVATAPNAGGASGFNVGIYLSTDNVITTGDIYLGSRWVTSLTSGASSTADTAVAIPGNISGGVYYLGAIADHSGSITETNENNNVLTGNEITIAGPDLTISALSGPSSALTGSYITIPNTVSATAGGGGTSGFSVKLYLSADSVTTATDIELTSRYVNGLAPGASSAENSRIQTPSSITPGIYYIGAIADTGNNIKETDESNNTLTGNQITIIGPDIIMSAVSAPTTVYTGNGFSVGNTVAAAVNAGNPDGFNVDLYLSLDNVITSSDIWLGRRTVYGLTAGSSNTASTAVTLSSTIAPGTYYIGAIADQWNSVKESDETNNVLAGNTVAVVGPDLTITSFSGPANSPTGNTITVANTVTAAAAGGSVSSSCYVSFYISTDSVITPSDYYVGSRYVSALAAGASSAENTLIRIPDAYDSGAFYIGAIVDYDDYIKESDETNNTASSPITVIGPDLTMTQVSGPTDAVFGQYVTVNNTVTTATNGGKPGTVFVQLYLSTDNVITQDDIYLGGRYVYDLASGGSSTNDTTVLIPYDLKRGTYYLGAIADPLDYVNESNETNNALAGNTIFIKR